MMIWEGHETRTGEENVYKTVTDKLAEIYYKHGTEISVSIRILGCVD